MEAVVADPVNPPIAVSIPSSTNREKFDLWEQYFWSRMGITAVGQSFPPWRVHLGQAPPPVGGWVVHLFIKVEMNRKCVWTTSPVRSLLTPSEPPIT